MLQAWQVDENKLSARWTLLAGIAVRHSWRRVNGTRVLILRLQNGKAWSLESLAGSTHALEAVHSAGLGGRVYDVYAAPAASPLAAKLADGAPLAEHDSADAVVALAEESTGKFWRVVRAHRFDRGPYTLAHTRL